MNLQAQIKSKPKKIFITFLAGIVILILPTFVSAQESCNLTYCVTKALENNYSLKIARNIEQQAENNYTKGNAGFLPTITTTNRIGGTLNSTNQTLRDGSNPITNGVHNLSGSANVNLDLTLFRGFNVQTTYEKLNELKLLGELSTQMNIENLISNIISEYYYLVQQYNLYKNLEYAVGLSRERVRIDEERYLLGASSKLELLQSMVYLNADSSRYAKQKETLQNSEMRLKKLMAVEDLEKKVTIKDSAIQINETLLYDDLLSSTLELNTGLMLAKKNQVISELDYKIIASRSYPYLNLSSGYNLSFNAYETGTLKNQQMRGMNYGLTLGMDIFDGYERRREKTNAKIDIESRNYRYQEIEQEVKVDLMMIYYAYQNNLQLMKLENQNLEVARENLGIALERYKLGNLSGLELREVQKSLLDAEERLILVQYQTKMAEISLLQISGRIMQQV